MNKKKNPAAVKLGKLAKGVPKNYSKSELERRTKRLLEAKQNLLNETPSATGPNHPKN